MYKLSKSEGAKLRKITPSTVSGPGSRNVWYLATCRTHGLTSFQTPFGCEACQRGRVG